jgi:DHA3 family macrolide efflux protein-like MFS transporter
MGLGFLVLGLIPASAFGLALAGLCLAGFMQPMADGPLFATIQTTVSPDMQGRVLSLLISVAKITSPLSLAVAGPLADALGVQVWYLAAGLLCLFIAVGAFFIPDVMRIEEQVHGPAS